MDAVATAFDVSARQGKRLSESLVDTLRAKRLLLVLDNAEHLLEPAAELVELLERTCAALVVLVTSREGLALEGERVLPVPSLGSPAVDADTEEASGADVVRLFVDRAQAADPDFGLTDTNVGAVVEVCRRLDGVPLAIELAAARISTMTPAELAQGLDRRLATLAGGRRRAVQRHQTLRAAIDWSYELLTESERRLLARLAVFAGGCSREAVEQVCGGRPVAPGQVFEALAGLVAKSLVVAQRTGTETRYRLLETIREYAEDRLAELGETDAQRTAHAEYFWELTRRRREQLYGPEQVTVARRLAADYDNLLAATQHALDTADPDLGLRLVSQQPPPPVQVGYRFVLPVDAVLGVPGASSHPLYAHGLAVAAIGAAFHGDLERAEAFAEQARSALPGGDDELKSLLCQAQGAVVAARGEFAESARVLAEGAEAARSSESISSAFRTAFCLAGAAMAYTMAGTPELGEPLAAEAVVLARQCGSPSAIAHSLLSLSGAVVGSDPTRARTTLEEALQIQQRYGLDTTAVSIQGTLMAARIGDWPLVLRVGVNALRHLQWTGDRSFLSGLLNVFARAIASSDPESAAVLQGTARRFAPPSPKDAPLARGEDIGPADASEAGSAPMSFLINVRRDTTAILRDAIGDEGVRELRGEGEAMEPDDVVRYALQVLQASLITLPATSGISAPTRTQRGHGTP
jgi:predicted ATPase